MVQPSNLADVVQEFIAHLALEPEKKFLLEQNDPGESFAFSQSLFNVIWNYRLASFGVAFRKPWYVIFLFVTVVSVGWSSIIVIVIN